MRYGRRRVQFRGAEVAAEDAAREARCQADFKCSFEENEDVFYLFQGATVPGITGAKGISQLLSDFPLGSTEDNFRVGDCAELIARRA